MIREGGKEEEKKKKKVMIMMKGVDEASNIEARDIKKKTA